MANLSARGNGFLPSIDQHLEENFASKPRHDSLAAAKPPLEFSYVPSRKPMNIQQRQMTYSAAHGQPFSETVGSYSRDTASPLYYPSAPGSKAPNDLWSLQDSTAHSVGSMDYHPGCAICRGPFINKLSSECDCEHKAFLTAVEQAEEKWAGTRLREIR